MNLCPKTIRERKAELVAALRLPPDEGGYLQGRGRLCWESLNGVQPDHFCCMGVATNLAVLAGACDWGGSATTPSAQVKRYFGLSGDAVSRCVFMNDNDRKTFPEIADWIEANL